MRDRPENFAGRWAAKEAVSKVLGPGRPRCRLARDRDHPPAHRRAHVPAPRPRPAARQPAGHGAHRGLHQPRARVRGGGRLRRPHRRAASSSSRSTWRRAWTIARSSSWPGCAACATSMPRCGRAEAEAEVGRRDRSPSEQPAGGALTRRGGSRRRCCPSAIPRGHKGTFGRVVVVAGSLDYAGAALMAGAAALRAGSGLVTLCVPASLQPLIAGRVPELITRGLPETCALRDRCRTRPRPTIAAMPCDALLLGPGLPPGRATTRLTASLLARRGSARGGRCRRAGRACGDTRAGGQRLGRAVVITPHPGEFARLGREAGTTDAERRTAARAAAREWGLIGRAQGCPHRGRGPRWPRRDGALRGAGAWARAAAATCWRASSPRW